MHVSCTYVMHRLQTEHYLAAPFAHISVYIISVISSITAIWAQISRKEPMQRISSIAMFVYSRAVFLKWGCVSP